MVPPVNECEDVGANDIPSRTQGSEDHLSSEHAIDAKSQTHGVGGHRCSTIFTRHTFHSKENGFGRRGPIQNRSAQSERVH